MNTRQENKLLELQLISQIEFFTFKVVTGATCIAEQV